MLDESQLLSIAERTSPEEAGAALTKTTSDFVDTKNALQPADFEVEEAEQRARRIFARGANQAAADSKEMEDQYKKLFGLSPKTNYDTAAGLLVLHAARQRVVQAVGALATEAIETAKAKRAALGLAHLKAELGWVKAKAIVEAQEMLSLIKPLLAFDENLKVDGDGRLSTYVNRITYLENLVTQQGAN